MIASIIPSCALLLATAEAANSIGPRELEDVAFDPFDPKDTALVVIDPQNDFLSESGIIWPLVKESATELNTVEHIRMLFQAADEQGFHTFISPHYYYPHDKGWHFEGAVEYLMHDTGSFDREGQLTLDGFEGSGADWVDIFKPYINGKERVVVASPHKIYGPEQNDLVLQLRKRSIDKIILAGMSANLCVESHMRELLEQGFEVHVVEDATAGAKDPDLGDGYAAALSNFKYIANGVIKTNDAVSRMGADLITDLLGEEGSNSEESTELEPATNEATTETRGAGARALKEMEEKALMFDPKDTALVVIDPQNDFLSESGVIWPLVKESATELNTIEHIRMLFEAADVNGFHTFISPHYYYPHDLGWDFEGTVEALMHETDSFSRAGVLNLDGFDGSGADWLDIFKPYIIDKERVIVTNPHKIYGPEANDLTLQLRKRSIDKIILAGMSANLCVESHMRELLEQGFEVYVVQDATAGAKDEKLGDGYDAALTNFKYIANGVVKTDKAVTAMADSTSEDGTSQANTESTNGARERSAATAAFVFAILASLMSM